MATVIYVSFTNTLHHIASGDYRLLAMWQPEVEFAFSCQREHVIREDGLIPYEVTWMNKDKPSCYGEDGCTGVARDKCDQFTLTVWDEFIRIICWKDKMGKVAWRTTNTPAFCKQKTFDGNVCYYRGKVYTLSEGDMGRLRRSQNLVKEWWPK